MNEYTEIANAWFLLMMVICLIALYLLIRGVLQK